MPHIDQSYIIGIRDGDDRVLLSIYKDFEPRITAFILKNSGSAEDAGEIFQRSIIALYEKFQKDPDFQLTSQFFTLLYSVSRNLWLKEIRRKKPDFSITDNEDVVSSLNPAEEKDFSDFDLQAQRHLTFWKGFEKLGEKCQKLLRAFFEDKPGEEIANLVDMTLCFVQSEKKSLYQRTERPHQKGSGIP